VLGGSSSIKLSNASLTMFTPANGINLYSVQTGDSAAGWLPWSGASDALSNGNPNVTMAFNAKIYCLNTPLTLFSSNNSVQAAYDGVIAGALTLAASASSDLSPYLSSLANHGNPPPPFRTLRITSTGPSTNSARTTAVIELSNFPTAAGVFPVTVLDWEVS
jgi:hypothetical protein